MATDGPGSCIRRAASDWSARETGRLLSGDPEDTIRRLEQMQKRRKYYLADEINAHVEKSSCLVNREG